VTHTTVRHVSRVATAAGTVALALISCRGIEVAQVRFYSVRISTPVVWTSSRVVLTSPDLAGPDTLPVVVIGTDTVSVRFAPPDSLIATAPSSPGLFGVLVGFRGQAPSIVGTVTLAGGYAGEWDVGPVSGRPQLWPGAPQTSFAIPADTGLAIVDPRLRMMRRVLGRSYQDASCMTGVGPAAGGRVAVGSCGGTLSVSLDPVAVADTGPAGAGRFAAQLAPGRWLAAWQHGVASFLRNATGGWDTAAIAYHIEEPLDIAVSPTGARAVIVGRDALGTGMPVFSPSSADPAYFLAGLHEIDGAAFNEAGDSLFVLGPSTLSIVRAQDGVILASIPSWTNAYRVVLDPGGKWIYLAGEVPQPGVPYVSQAPALQVLDRATLAPVTTIHAPFGTDLGGSDLYPVLSPSEHRLYVVATCAFCNASRGTTVPVYAFDLMP